MHLARLEDDPNGTLGRAWEFTRFSQERVQDVEDVIVAKSVDAEMGIDSIVVDHSGVGIDSSRQYELTSGSFPSSQKVPNTWKRTTYQIETIKFISQTGKDFFDLLQIAQVASDPFDLSILAFFPALIGDPLNGFIALFLLSVGENDSRAHEGKVSTDFLSDPLSTARDEGSLACEVGLFGTRRSDDGVENLLHVFLWVGWLLWSENSRIQTVRPVSFLPLIFLSPRYMVHEVI